MLHGLAGAALAAATGARAQTALPSFVALGDWGRAGDRHQLDVAASMARAAAEIGSRFVISVGDNFYPAGVQSVDDPQWQASFEQVYAAPSLQTPWYVALGNHDYRGRPGAQTAYARTNGRWKMPNRHYVVSGVDLGLPDLDLFVLDTTPIAGDSDEAFVRLARGRISMPNPEHQVEWLQAALKRSRADWKVVVGHHPIHSGGHHGGSPALAEQVEPLLLAHGVQAYLCGHDHVQQHIQVGGAHHICTGAGSSAGEVEDVPGTLFRSGEPGFAMFTLGSDTLVVEFRDMAGRSLYRGAIPKGRA